TYGVGVPTDHGLSRPYRIPTRHVHRETLTLLLHRVDAQVHEHGTAVLARDDERMRVQGRHRAVDRGQRVRTASVRLHRDPRPHHRLREHGVRHLGHRHRRPGDRTLHDHAHSRSWMSSAMASASGPTTTCTTLPIFVTPCTPSCLSAPSSTTEPSSSSQRNRVMHPSISMTLSAPPSAARIFSGLSSAIAASSCSRVVFSGPQPQTSNG